MAVVAGEVIQKKENKDEEIAKALAFWLKRAEEIRGDSRASELGHMGLRLYASNWLHFRVGDEGAGVRTGEDGKWDVLGHLQGLGVERKEALFITGISPEEFDVHMKVLANRAGKGSISAKIGVSDAGVISENSRRESITSFIGKETAVEAGVSVS